MVELAARVYKPEDYDKLCDMWEGQDLTCPPIDVLGEYGIVVEYGEMPISAIFIYEPKSSMGMLEFMVANGKADKKIRNDGIDLMLRKAVEVCKKMGYKYIYTATSSDKFINRLEENNFKSKGAKQQHMFWGV